MLQTRGEPRGNQWSSMFMLATVCSALAGEPQCSLWAPASPWARRELESGEDGAGWKRSALGCQWIAERRSAAKEG